MKNIFKKIVKTGVCLSLALGLALSVSLVSAQFGNVETAQAASKTCNSSKSLSKGIVAKTKATDSKYTYTIKFSTPNKLTQAMDTVSDALLDDMVNNKCAKYLENIDFDAYGKAKMTMSFKYKKIAKAKALAKSIKKAKVGTVTRKSKTVDWKITYAELLDDETIKQLAKVDDKTKVTDVNSLSVSLSFKLLK